MYVLQRYGKKLKVSLFWDMVGSNEIWCQYNRMKEHAGSDVARSNKVRDTSW